MCTGMETIARSPCHLAPDRANAWYQRGPWLQRGRRSKSGGSHLTAGQLELRYLRYRLRRPGTCGVRIATGLDCRSPQWRDPHERRRTCSGDSQARGRLGQAPRHVARKNEVANPCSHGRPLSRLVLRLDAVFHFRYEIRIRNVLVDRVGPCIRIPGGHISNKVAAHLGKRALARGNYGFAHGKRLTDRKPPTPSYNDGNTQKRAFL